MSNKLPEPFMKKYEGKSKGSTMYGIPMEELTKEELLAVIAFQAEDAKNKLESHKRTEQFLSDIRQH